MWSPVGIRTTTLTLAFILFACGLMVRRSLLHAVLAPTAWLLGWETTWGVTTYLVARPAGHLGPIWWIGLPAAALAYTAGVQVDWRWLALTAGIWVVWLATGWHYNVITSPKVDWLAEAFNEAAKIGWGLAYLWPILRPDKRPSTNHLARLWRATTHKISRRGPVPVAERPAS
jgi:hypothetical protein